MILILAQAYASSYQKHEHFTTTAVTTKVPTKAEFPTCGPYDIDSLGCGPEVEEGIREYSGAATTMYRGQRT